MPFQSGAKPENLSPDLPSGQFSHLDVVHPPFDESPNHVFAGLAHDDPIYHRSCLVNQLGAMASQISKIPLGSIADNAPLKRPALEKVRDPLRILNVSLSSRDILDMPCVYEQDIESAFKNVVDGLREDAGKFHGQVGTPLLGHPIGKYPDVLRHRAEGLHILLDFPILANATHACLDATSRPQLLV